MGLIYHPRVWGYQFLEHFEATLIFIQSKAPASVYLVHANPTIDTSSVNGVVKYFVVAGCCYIATEFHEGGNGYTVR